MYSTSIRHTTPPSLSHQAFFPESVENQFSHYAYYSSNDNSPDSIITNNTSPQRSPENAFRTNGPPLLPKIRCQDQTTEPTSTAGPVRHGRCMSLAVNNIHSAYPYALPVSRRGTSPLENVDLHSPASICSLPISIISTSLSPASALTAVTTPSSVIGTVGSTPPPLLPPSCSSAMNPTGLNSPIAISNNQGSRRSSLAHVRTASTSLTNSQGHSRSGSSSSVDESVILRHGYPTQYRQLPQYITAAPMVQAVSAPTVSNSIVSFSSQPQSDLFLPDDTSLLSTDFEYGSFSQGTTSLLSYLTAQNPSPRLVNRSITDTIRLKDYWWWDVRNLRSWSSFSIDTVLAVPGFPQLLQLPLDYAVLPHPQATSSSPDHQVALRDVYNDYFATKINAALETTQGSRHLSMRAYSSTGFAHYPKPDFISTYPNDFLKTLRGDPRGRLVGIVKSYDEWNSGMRSQQQPGQVKYLAGLSQLYRVMREHSCRYGFIITEIELVCVRAGAEDAEYNNMPHGNNSPDDGPKPIFGFLELSTPVQLSTCGLDQQTGAPRLTAGMALWFLHMLAKEEPLPGMPLWKVEVGGPVAVTRNNCRERDAWMPKVAVHESRKAKRVRGWVWPEEPYSRKESPNLKRRGGIA